MRGFLIIITFLLFVAIPSAFSQAEETASKKIKGKHKIKMSQARHEYLNGNPRVALNLFREVHRDIPKNATVNYRIAECHYAINNKELAVEYFKNALSLNEKVDKQAYFWYGMSLHRNGQLDEAFSAFEKFKATAKPAQLKQTHADHYIAQINEAKLQMSKPINVSLKNLGENVNSRFDDYSPSITADGKTMIFTSRRPDTQGGKVDEKSDNKYFEDIYISHFDEKENTWSEAEPIPGKINTVGHDASLGISKDGSMIFVYRNDGNLYIGDIFLSKISVSSNKWSTPKPLSKTVNSSYFESSASLSPDGKTLYFVSERPKGSVGHADIYMSKRISKYNWTEPKNLGPVINSKEDEISVFIHPDGKTLFFSSKGNKSMGGYDIFMSRMNDDSTWTEPMNLGYPINTVDDDLHFVLSADYKTAYYSSIRPEGMGERDLYEIDFSHYDIMQGMGAKLSILKGKVLINDTSLTNIPKIEITDSETGKTIFAIETDDESREYFITLTGDKKYKVTASASGHKSVTEEMYIPYTTEKTFVMEKVFDLPPTP
ncbi:MAG: tetratricopeptide repeat protein [Bacteroidetes bacterium]|nr:hypothetical protein [Bacteroidota bacterium]MBV6461912.1 hypothetical protein [Flavobacteriales bacterium]WKZ74482.1 MAG: tetratricopeptide repeat protein [Vicingaceae bacterium]MCL4816210.1 PD40 domain-containing protein [Flavobacteriales bacterium]NOG95096.1 tetratricopeptide repeat protein [Bacteroidota bacterium]